MNAWMNVTKEEGASASNTMLWGSSIAAVSIFSDSVEKEQPPSIYFQRAKAGKQLKPACPSPDAEKALSFLFQPKPLFLLPG